MTTHPLDLPLAPCEKATEDPWTVWNNGLWLIEAPEPLGETLASAATELPELPEPACAAREAGVDGMESWPANPDYYTADQMRAYATEAAAYWKSQHATLLIAFNKLADAGGEET